MQANYAVEITEALSRAVDCIVQRDVCDRTLDCGPVSETIAFTLRNRSFGTNSWGDMIPDPAAEIQKAFTSSGFLRYPVILPGDRDPEELTFEIPNTHDSLITLNAILKKTVLSKAKNSMRNDINNDSLAEKLELYIASNLPAAQANAGLEEFRSFRDGLIEMERHHR